MIQTERPRTSLAFAGMVLFALALTACSKDGASKQASQERQISKGALTKAASVGDLRLTRELIDRGADVNERLGTTGKEITPLLAAVAGDHEQVVYALLKSGATVHSSYSGYTARDFSHFLNGDDSALTRALILREVNH
jgi:hypothetical protein